VATLTTTAKRLPWWREPTRDQWYAFVAAWLGWTLDAFDFTVFLLIMHPIAATFRSVRKPRVSRWSQTWW
jgi:MFS transporter, SHS family, lactate transporter